MSENKYDGGYHCGKCGLFVCAHAQARLGQLQADYLKLRDELGQALHEVDQRKRQCRDHWLATKERRAPNDDVTACIDRLRTERDTARDTAARLMEIVVRLREETGLCPLCDEHHTGDCEELEG